MRRAWIEVMTFALLACLTLSLAGCGGEEGDLEKAGKEADKAVEDAGEQAGEALEDAGDAVKDLTD